MSALSDAIRRLYETDPDFEVYAYLADEVEKVEDLAALRRDLLEERDREIERIGKELAEAEAMVERAFALAEAIENEDDERWSFRYASRIRDALKGRS